VWQLQESLLAENLLLNQLVATGIKAPTKQWGCATGNATTVATATFYVLKDKQKRFRDRRATFTTVYVVGW
jgi:hypothetical protein